MTFFHRRQVLSWWNSKTQFSFQKQRQLESLNSVLAKKKPMNLGRKSEKALGEIIKLSPKATLWYLQKKVPWSLCEEGKCKITSALLKFPTQA